MLVFCLMTSLVLVASTLQMVGGGLSLRTALMAGRNRIGAETIAASVITDVRSYMQTQIDANATFPVNTTFTINVTAPTSPSALTGATTQIGSVVAKIVRSRAPYYVVELSSTFGTSTRKIYRTLYVTKTPPVVPPMGYRFVGRQNNAAFSGFSTGLPLGDTNGDGYSDFLIPSPYYNPGDGERGEVYLVLGRSTTQWNSLMDANGDYFMTNLTSDWSGGKNPNIYRFIGPDDGNGDTHYGRQVSGGGDINNDGYNDFVITANRQNGYYSNGTDMLGGLSGEVDIWFGRANWSTLPHTNGDYNVDQLDSIGGVLASKQQHGVIRVFAETPGAQMGEDNSFHVAGDLDGDGYKDLIFNTGGYKSPIRTIILFGRPLTTVDAAQAGGSLTPWYTMTDSKNRFYFSNWSSYCTRANGCYAISSLSTSGGWQYAGPVGDINKDGYDDLVLNSWSDGGFTIVFGRPRNTGAANDDWNDLMASDTDGVNNNFVFKKADNTFNTGTTRNLLKIGNDSDARSSWNSAMPLGDINGDTFADFMFPSGASLCFIFGRSTANWTALDQSDSAGVANGTYVNTNGAAFECQIPGSLTHFAGWGYGGFMNAYAGNMDIDNDGNKDVVIGDYRYGDNYNGQGYLFFGRSNWLTRATTYLDTGIYVFETANVSAATDTLVFQPRTGAFTGSSSQNVGAGMSFVGDTNGDGYNDIYLGAINNWGSGNPGEAYLIFGRSRANWDSVENASGNYMLDNL